MKKIVLYQSSPRIRLYKYSKLFSKMGHEVSCFYVDNDFSYHYTGLELSHFKQIKKINNLNDFLGYDHIFLIDLVCVRGVHQALVRNNINVKFLIGDVWLLRNGYDVINKKLLYNNNLIQNEINVLNKYDYTNFIFSGELMKNHVSDALNLPKIKESLVVPNTNFMEWINKDNFKEKLSKKDDMIHIVYVGGVTRKNEIHHRNFYESFDKLTKNTFICLHVYPTNHLCNDYPKKKNIIYHDRCPIQNLVQEISQYDMGLLTFNMTGKDGWYINVSDPNKLYDYTYAKLPIICNNSLSYKQMIEQNNLGKCVNNLDNITKDELYKIIENYNYDYSFKTFDDYQNVVSKYFFK